MTESRKHAKHGFPIGGMVLVYLGVVLLLQNFGVLPWGLWGTLWRFWPVLVIIVGINVLLGRSRPWAAGIIALVVMGASLALAMALWHNESPPSGRSASSYSEVRGDVERAVVQIDFKAGQLTLSALSPGSANLVEATSRPEGLKADFRRSDGQGHLALSSEWSRTWFGHTGEWILALTRDIPIALEVDSAAAAIDLDLDSLMVTSLDLTMNAGQCILQMPASAGVSRAHIKANAANLEVRIPQGVAAQIDADVSVGTVEIDRSRFPRNGDYHVSPGFEGSSQQLYLTVDCNAGRVRIS